MNPNLTANLRASRELQTEINNQGLKQVDLALQTALPWLEQAYCLMNSNRLDKRYSQLYTAICDAMTATQEACERIEDTPDFNE